MTATSYCYADGIANTVRQTGKLTMRAEVRSADGSMCLGYTLTQASDLSSEVYAFDSTACGTFSVALKDTSVFICNGESTVLSSDCPGLDAISETLDQYFLDPSTYDCGYGVCPPTSN